jgi:hypothetical protein
MLHIAQEGLRFDDRVHAPIYGNAVLAARPRTGLQPDRTAGLFGASLALRLAPQWRAFATYDAQVRGSDFAHLVSGGVKANW